jgi:hypothetical protein
MSAVYCLPEGGRTSAQRHVVKAQFACAAVAATAAQQSNRGKFGIINRLLDILEHRIAFSTDFHFSVTDGAPMRTDVSQSDGSEFGGECRAVL